MSNEKEAEWGINVLHFVVEAKSKDPYVINEIFKKFGKPSGSFKRGIYYYDEKIANMIQNGV